MASPLVLTFEAQAAGPNLRHDLVQPLLLGRVPLEGVVLQPSPATASAGMFDNPKFQRGEFGLLDANWGDVLPAIEHGWDMVCIPVFLKRRPAYNFLWVREGRGIDTPQGIAGKTVATMRYGTAANTYVRGFLQHFYNVDLTTITWQLSGPERFALYDPRVRIEPAPGPHRSPAERLLAGEVDACSTGDITDHRWWDALEADPQVRRLFPDYREVNFRLFREHGIYTPWHVLVMGGATYRSHPGLTRRLYEAFVASGELALEDALGDGTSYSLLVDARETLRDQLVVCH